MVYEDVTWVAHDIISGSCDYDKFIIIIWINFSEISGSHGGEEEDCLLGCCAV
jgi:hypothetical protein